MMPDVERYHARISGDPLRNAFDGRSPLMPWLDFQPVPAEDVAPTWDILRRTPRGGKTVAYVHIPFCGNHCLFCGFYRNATRRNVSKPYLDALVREIEREADTLMVDSGPVHAVYLGGGTPTDLDTPDLARLIETLRRCLPLAADCEITVEARATGCPPEKIAACLGAGANRFSFGVQTFDTKVRRRLGRKMDTDELTDFLAGVCSMDRATVVCDLIFGLPQQTGESWLRDIEIAASIGLDGVDLYALTLLPTSPLATAIRKGSLPAGAGTADQATLYAMGVEALDGKGWRQLTSAHFSRETRERNLYNQLIKAGAACLAYGAGAGGLAGNYSYLVTMDLARYHELNTEDRKPLGGLYDTGRGRAAKAVATGGIETGRLDFAMVEEAGVPRFAQAALPLARQWEQAGLVSVRDETIRLTLPGRFWHTNLTSALHHIIATLLSASTTSSPPGNSHNHNHKPMKPSDASDQEKRPLLETLRAKFAQNADGILEMIAAQSGLTTREVTGCLPESCCLSVGGEHFEAVMNEMSGWGEILLIVHTPDAIIECAGPLSKGSFGRGFFNLGPGSPIRGHIRAEHCADICLVRRPFMGRETCSVQFFNSHGDAMFKVFVSRAGEDGLNGEQVRRFEALRERFQETAPA